jgi:hypothetical protein
MADTPLYLIIHRATGAQQARGTADAVGLFFWGTHTCEYLVYKGEVPVPLPCGGSIDDVRAVCDVMPLRLRGSEYLTLQVRHGPWYVTNPQWRGCIREHPCFADGHVAWETGKSRQ